MMRWIYKLPLRLRSLFRKTRVEQELTEELRFHLEELIEEKAGKGMTAEEARYAALRELGGVEQIKEECRDMRRVNYIEDFFQDIRYGVRMLVKNSGFTAVAVLTLALGIGANTAIFSVVEAVLLHPAPYENPTQLVEISARSPQGEQDRISVGDFCDWQSQGQAFQGLAAYQQWEFHMLTGTGQPDEVFVSPVSDNLFRLLGVNAALGRTFVASESQAVVLSHQYWRSHFSADPAIVGKLLALDGKPYTVVGVAPADFEFPRANTQMWIPLAFSAAEKNDHENHSLHVIARLKAGFTQRQAQAEMDTVARRLAIEYPKTDAGWSAPVETFRGQEISRTFQGALLALLGAVVFVLLIVCANVASMLLARGAARQGEMAIRAALGASGSRLIRQLVVESLMLAGAASVGGLVLASSGLGVIVSLVPKYTLIETHGLHRIAINLPVLGFTVALSLLAGIVIGLLPALRVSKLDLNESLKEGGRNSATSAKRPRLQRALVVLEVALALVLLVGAGLMIQTFKRLATAPTGFNPDHVLTVRVPLAEYKYMQGPKSAEFYRGVLERIQAIPGVKSAGMANNLPFTGFHTSVIVPLPGNSPGGLGRTVGIAIRCVSPGYFQAMGIPLKEGRDFTLSDGGSSSRDVMIINEAMARRYWPGEDPVGKHYNGSGPKGWSSVIVGVVGDSKQDSVDSQAEPELYQPYAQYPFASFLVTFVIRTASSPLDLAAAVRKAVWEVDSDQPVIQIRTMENVISESIWQQHFSASMLGAFAAIALLLSAVGIYGLLSYSVSRRTHEIGIRTALGATRRDILRLVVGEGLMLTLIGVGAGILVALGLTRLIASLLYGVRPRDPLTFVALSLLLTGVALLAVYIPARRATKVDPMVALRYE
jgi:putative ABC transport system permease protein